MTNWTVTISRPNILETKELLVPKHHVAELLEDILKSDEWCERSSITIKPTEMEYFDGRP